MKLFILTLMIIVLALPSIASSIPMDDIDYLSLYRANDACYEQTYPGHHPTIQIIIECNIIRNTYEEESNRIKIEKERQQKKMEKKHNEMEFKLINKEYNKLEHK